MRTYDVAIVGTGGIAGVHARDLATLGGRARLVAAVDINAGRLAAFGNQWSVRHRFADLAEMLAHVRPDLVHLCTPPGMHRAQALACLAAGATVLCEKPPALSLAELDEIAAAEARGQGHFATVFQHRFGSGAHKLRRLIAAGTLGRSMTAVCNTLWYRPDEYFAVPWRGKWDVEGGGPTMGHGIHQFDLLLSILGPWREVVAVADRRARPTATEDVSAALVTFADGTLASVVNSLVSPRETSYLRFDFEHATIELEHLYGYDDASWTVTPTERDPAGVAGAWAAGPVGQPSGHAAQLAIVLDALDTGATPPVSSKDAYATMELIAAIYASAFTGERIRRGQIGPDSPFYHRMDGSGTPWPAPTLSISQAGRDT
jgi:predicted dehydrogenase